MSAIGFDFPPPPPPPPRQSHNTVTHPRRGQTYGGGSSRGRGSSRGALNPRGDYGCGRNRGNCNSNSLTSKPSRRPASNIAASLTPKRSHSIAFPNNPHTRPQAPAAVPSFNAGLERLLMPKPVSKMGHRPPQKKTNLLGLTPSTVDISESDDDGDEEARFANESTCNDLQFEYKGHTSTLRTTAEIAAWLAERKKRWPTEARRKAAKLEAEEQRRKLGEERRQKIAGSCSTKQNGARTWKKKKSSRDVEKTQQTTLIHDDAQSDPVMTGQIRAEYLRRKAEKAQRRFEMAERELLQAGQPLEAINGGSPSSINPKLTSDDNSASSLSDSSELTQSDSDTSSSSDSEDGSGPEESSSKVETADISALAVETGHKKKPCQFFLRRGTCKYGTRCRHSHDYPPSQSRRSPTSSRSKAARKGLWQVMFEKEQEQEREKILSAIIALGKQGILDGPL